LPFFGLGRLAVDLEMFPGHFENLKTLCKSLELGKNTRQWPMIQIELMQQLYSLLKGDSERLFLAFFLKLP